MTMSVDNDMQASSGDQSPLAQSTRAGAGVGHSNFDFDMYPSAPPSPESINKMHLADETTAEAVSTDEVAIIFSFLLPKDIMRARICTTWRDAAKKTLVPVPPSEFRFRVGSVKSYNAMRAMSSALPHLQQLSISNINGRHKYSDGDDPDERRARYTANCTTHDINIISNFRKLCSLEIRGAHLSGRYPVLSTFPLLQRLSITNCFYLKWDLEMLASFPLLRELQVGNSFVLTGDLSSLRALRDTLEMVKINGGDGLSPNIHIRGNFMDLAAFPRLKELDLYGTTVTGDIRDIRQNDFPALESLALPKSVHGGVEYRFQRVSDVPSFMHAVHLLLQRTPTLFSNCRLSEACCWGLSEASPDCYGRDDINDVDWDERDDGEIGIPPPPFDLRFVRAGSRHGWSWCSYDYEDGCHSCEINWLDAEPSSDSSGYQTYIKELRRVEQCIDFYRGYYEIPTEDEYHRLCEELL